MSKGRHGKAFHQVKKKKKSRRQQEQPVTQQPVASQPVEPEAPFIEEKIAEPAAMVEKPAVKQERNIAMLADLKMVAILAVIMLVTLIVLSQVMG